MAQAVLVSGVLGEHFFLVIFKGVSLQRIPIIVVPQHLDVVGLDDGAVGVDANFAAIFRRKENGAVVPSNGRFTCKITGPDGDVPCAISVNPSEGNDVQYMPTAAGEHEVKLFYRDVSCYKTTVNAYDFDFDGLAGGDGKGNNAVVDCMSSFSMGVKGKGEGYCLPPDMRVLLVGPSGEIECDMSLNDNGTAKCSYTPTAVGEHTLRVVKGDVVMREIPVNVVYPRTLVEGAGVLGCAVGIAAPFTVTCLDGTGRPFSPPNGRVRVEVLDPNGVAMEVKEVKLENGVLQCEYTPQGEGQHTVRVHYGPDEVFSTRVTAVSFEFEGVGTKVAIVNAESTFTVRMRDSPGGDWVQTNGDLEANLEDESGLQTPCLVVEEGTTTTMSYIPNVAGAQEISVFYKGLEVKTMKVIAYSLIVTGDGLKRAYLGIPAVYEATFDDDVLKSEVRYLSSVFIFILLLQSYNTIVFTFSTN